MDLSKKSSFSTASGLDYHYVVLQVTLKVIVSIQLQHQMVEVKDYLTVIEFRLQWFLKKLNN